MHSNNIIHKDLKPSNIFISEIEKTKDGKKLKIKILKIGDFGISKSFDDLKRTDTLTGKTTPAYKAPEVIDE